MLLVSFRRNFSFDSISTFRNLIVFSYLSAPQSHIFFSFQIYLFTFFAILKTKLSFVFARSHLPSSGPKRVQSAGAFFALGTSVGISFEAIFPKLFLHRRVLDTSRASSMLRVVQPRLVRKPRSRRVPEITLPTVEEDPSLACTSSSRGYYCNTQHLHLGFFFRVTCSTCDASPGPCAVILATSTVAVLDDAAFSLTG